MFIICLFIIGFLLLGTATSLASPNEINRICKIACLVDINPTPPFKVQFQEPSAVWLDFCFIDQLEIVSRLCGFIAASDELVSSSTVVWREDGCPGESNPIRIPSRRAAGWLGWTCPTVCIRRRGAASRGSS